MNRDGGWSYVEKGGAQEVHRLSTNRLTFIVDVQSIMPSFSR